MVKGRVRRVALSIALVGIMAASLECVKLILAAIPNVEAVTLLTALYGYVFGGLGILASVIFVCIEPMIWGMGSWMISYFIYWPLLALLFMLLGRVRLKNRWILTLIAVAMTLLFGILTSLVDVGLFSGSYDNFFERFSIYYLRGISFYITQMITNAVLFPLLFLPLSSALGKINRGIR